MRLPDLPKQPPKVEYTEDETARLLNVSIEELRALVRKHITGEGEDVSGMPLASFHPSDLVVLRILVSPQSTSAA